MTKVLLITNTVAPYRISVLNKVHYDNTIDLTVWYLQEKESNRSWIINFKELKYKYKCLRGFHFYVQTMDLGLHINPGLFLQLLKHNPDIIITSGYDALGYWSALLYCKLLRKKYLVWWGSTLESSRVKNNIVNKIRRYFFSKADAYITYGTSATNCLVHYGVNPSKIVTGFNTVDVNYYYKNTVNKKNRKVSQTTNMLFVGQIIDRKGLKEIILALSNLMHENWILKIVGKGPHENTLKKLVEELNLSERISFEGYKQKDELIQYIIEADCLVFPSLVEVWGLVVNEVLSTRTYVLASKYAGSTNDLITHRVNGSVIDPLDQKDLINEIQWFIRNKDDIYKTLNIPLSLWRKLHPYSYAKAVIDTIKLLGNKEPFL